MGAPFEKQRGVVLECHGHTNEINITLVVVKDVKIVKMGKLIRLHISQYFDMSMDL